jgi:hypothetical protein
MVVVLHDNVAILAFYALDVHHLGDKRAAAGAHGRLSGLVLALLLGFAGFMNTMAFILAGFGFRICFFRASCYRSWTADGVISKLQNNNGLLRVSV